MTTNISSLKQYSFRYSFAVDGGAVSTIQAPYTLPGGCIVVLTTVNVIAAVTSGGAATVAFGTGAGANIANWLAATAVAALGTGVILSGTPATDAIIAAAGEKPSITIATAALTAGIFDVTIQYIEK